MDAVEQLQLVLRPGTILAVFKTAWETKKRLARRYQNRRCWPAVHRPVSLDEPARSSSIPARRLGARTRLA